MIITSYASLNLAIRTSKNGGAVNISIKKHKAELKVIIENTEIRMNAEKTTKLFKEISRIRNKKHFRQWLRLVDYPKNSAIS